MDLCFSASDHKFCNVSSAHILNFFFNKEHFGDCQLHYLFPPRKTGPSRKAVKKILRNQLQFLYWLLFFNFHFNTYLLYLDAFFLSLAARSAAVGSLTVTSYSFFYEKLNFEYSPIPSKCLHNSLLLIKFPSLGLCTLTVSFHFPLGCLFCHSLSWLYAWNIFSARVEPITKLPKTLWDRI